MIMNITWCPCETVKGMNSFQGLHQIPFEEIEIETFPIHVKLFKAWLVSKGCVRCLIAFGQPNHHPRHHWEISSPSYFSDIFDQWYGHILQAPVWQYTFSRLDFYPFQWFFPLHSRQISQQPYAELQNVTGMAHISVRKNWKLGSNFCENMQFCSIINWVVAICSNS